MAQKLKSLPDSSWSLLHANASLIRGPKNLGRVHDLGQTYRRKEIELRANTVHDIVSSSVIEPILLMEEILHQLISHYLQGVLRPRWCRISSINSTILFFMFHPICSKCF